MSKHENVYALMFYLTMSASWRNFPLSTPVKIALRQGKKISPLPPSITNLSRRLKRSCTDCSVCLRQHHPGQKVIFSVNWTRYNRPWKLEQRNQVFKPKEHKGAIFSGGDLLVARGFDGLVARWPVTPGLRSVIGNIHEKSTQRER